MPEPCGRAVTLGLASIAKAEHEVALTRLIAANADAAIIDWHRDRLQEFKVFAERLENSPPGALGVYWAFVASAANETAFNALVACPTGATLIEVRCERNRWRAVRQACEAEIGEVPMRKAGTAKRERERA